MTEVVSTPPPAAPAEGASPDAAPAETSSITPAAAAMHTIKVGGKVREVDTQTLISLAQKAEGSDLRFKEAKSRTEAVEQLWDSLNHDFEGTIEKLGKALGKNFDDVAIARLERQMQAEMKPKLTPEEQRLLDLEKKLARYEEQEKAAKSKADDEQHQLKVNAAIERIDNLINSAFEHHGFPKNAKFVDKAAEYIADFYSYTGESPDIWDLVQHLKEQADSEIEHTLLNGEEVDLSRIPPKVLEAIRKADIQKLIGDQAKQPETRTEPKRRKESSGYMTVQQWRERTMKN